MSRFFTWLVLVPLTLGLPLPSTTSPASVALPDRFVGAWQGTVRQAAPSAEWPLVMVLVAGSLFEMVGTVEYPTLGCGSELFLERIAAGIAKSVTLSTVVVFGTCPAGAFILWPVEDSLRFHWTGSDGGQSAHGLLRPDAQSAVCLPVSS